MFETTKFAFTSSNVQLSETRTNLIPFINYSVPAPERCLNMLLAKYQNQHFQTEVMMTPSIQKERAHLKCPLQQATLLCITDGGLVPSRNPDRIPSTSADRFGIYSIRNLTSLSSEDYEVSHQGYDNSFVEEDPNRMLPLDALRLLEKKRRIKKIYPYFLSTTGVMMSQHKSQKVAAQIAQYVITHGIDAVLITSACGTSTRSGSLIGLEIEKNRIPVVQITALPDIAKASGLTRIVKGQNVCYPCGNPHLSPDMEFSYRFKLTEEALKFFQNSSVT